MIVLAVLLLLTIDPKPDCEAIRAQVSQHGKIKAYAWARKNGFSIADIYRVKKMCGL